MRQTARPVVSDLFTSLVVRQPVYNISIPVRRGNEVRFVMSLGLLPEDLRALLQSQSLPAGWSAAIWDSKGVIMARLRDQARLVGTAVPPRLARLPPGKVVRTRISTATRFWLPSAAASGPTGPSRSPSRRRWSTSS